MSNEYDDDQPRSVDDVLRGGGGKPYLKFDEVGDSFTGTLVNAKMVPVKYPKDHPQAGEHKTYAKSGRKAYKIELTLENVDDERRENLGDDDDFGRRHSVKEFGPVRDALSEAMDVAGFAKISDAYGHQLTMRRIQDGPPPFKGAQNEFRFEYEFDSADKTLGRGKPADPAKKETRPAKPKETRESARPARPAPKKDTRALLRDNGIPEELADMVGEDPTPELIDALRNQYAR